MRDIYLIDFENVASEGLNGITYLAPEDEVIIFYSNNSKSLSMKMHILIGKSICKLSYFEATVGGKNALDHQISTWLGYLVGIHAAERNYYIVSRDMGYKFVASFWAGSQQKPSVRCVESIRAAGRLERKYREKVLEITVPSQVEEMISAATGEVTPPESPVEAAAPQEEQVPQKETAAPGDPEAASEETEGHIRSYRGRQRYRRGRKNPRQEPNGEERATELSQAKPEEKQPVLEQLTQEKPQEKPQEIKPVVNPQEKPQEVKPVVKSQEKPQEPKPVVKSQEKPQEVKPVVNPQEKPQEVKPVMKHQEKSQEVKPVVKAQEKPQEVKPVVKPQEKPQEQKPESHGEKKPEQRERHTPRKPEEPRRVELGSLLAAYPELQEQQLQQLIADNKRQVLCNTLRKLLGQEKGLALYHEIKKSAWR